MKAVVYSKFGPPEVLQVADVEKPVPGDGDVLIRIHATAVLAEDPVMRRSRGLNGITRPKNPVLGQELSGVVEAIGKDVTRFAVGDEVYAETGMGLGSYAQYTCMKETGALAIKPANLTHEEAVAIPNGMLTVLPFLRDKAKLGGGQSVLIYGASGAVGTAAVQYAKHIGAEVDGVCSTANIELVESLGASRVFDYTKEDFTQSGKTYDVVFDTVGKASYWRCRGSLKPRGLYLTTMPSLGFAAALLCTLLPGGKRARTEFAGLRPAADKAKNLDIIRELVETGAIMPVIDRVYALDEIAEAHRYVELGHKKGNVVVAVG